MISRKQFYDDLMNDVRARAELESDFMETAFLNQVVDTLIDAEEIGNVTPVHFAGRGRRGRLLAVSAYDMDESDDSVALIVVNYEEGSDIETLTTTEAERHFKSVQFFLEEALSGTLKEGLEESTTAYELAEELRRRGRTVTRYRTYLITNKALSSRAKDFISVDVGGIPLEFHVWDVERFWQVAESTSGREDLTIDLREWACNGVPALKAASAKSGTSTYLCVFPARLLADLYGRYGGRLLQGNVRSYLSNTGKVNKGIRETVLSRPDLFLAYNNGITATAKSVEIIESSIIRVTDLQIVNGGQTTASLFYSMRGAKEKIQFDDAYVQAKLVVVSEDSANDLVPRISRYANSQNKINEADFFSNSPFHIRLEELSRRILTPGRAGVQIQSKWFYERTRGQYATEKAKAKAASATEEKKFLASYPRNQVMSKTDAAKFLMSWDRKPDVVSTGAQKNFTAFANSITKEWEASPDSFNAAYFKDLVAKAILFNSIRASVAKQPWYELGYLAAIVTYTVAKIADELAKSGHGTLDFDAIWQRQAVSDVTMQFALDVARQVLGVLDSDLRLKANVTEWAKMNQCWERVQYLKVDMPANLIAELASAGNVRAAKRNARAEQIIDNGIFLQKTVLEISAAEWAETGRFALANKILRPSDASILALVTGSKKGIPTEKQCVRLMELRERAIAAGYAYERS